MSEAQGLTSNIFKVDGLSVGVEQLDDGVVIVLHSAADGGHFPFNHRHIVSRQVLTFNLTTQKKYRWKKLHFRWETGYLQPIKYLFFSQQGLHVNTCTV